MKWSQLLSQPQHLLLWGSSQNTAQNTERKPETAVHIGRDRAHNSLSDENQASSRASLRASSLPVWVVTPETESSMSNLASDTPQRSLAFPALERADSIYFLLSFLNSSKFLLETHHLDDTPYKASLLSKPLLSNRTFYSDRNTPNLRHSVQWPLSTEMWRVQLRK